MIDLIRHINPERLYINDYKDMGNDIIAHRYSICLSDSVCYAVYRKTATMSGYSSYASNRELYPGCWLGDITTQDLPASIDVLPAWVGGRWPVERIRAVDAWHESLKQLAHAYIYAAFPSDFTDLS
jgi:hypothetical protein